MTDLAAPQSIALSEFHIFFNGSETALVLQARSYMKEGRYYRFYSVTDSKLTEAFKKDLHITPLYEVAADKVFAIQRKQS